MRKHPLLALLSTAASLAAASTLGTSIVDPTETHAVANATVMPQGHQPHHHRSGAVVAFVRSRVTAVLATAPVPFLLTLQPARHHRALPFYDLRARPRRSPGTSASAAPGEAQGVWLELRRCESGDDYSENTGNGYYGAYQFALSTWWAIGEVGTPNDASPAVQDAAAARLQSEMGWSPWPVCSVVLGLR